MPRKDGTGPPPGGQEQNGSGKGQGNRATSWKGIGKQKGGKKGPCPIMDRFTKSGK